MSAVVLGAVIATRGVGQSAYCAAPLHDFGDVKIGSSLSHVFRVQNRSSVDVDSIVVAASCSKCSSAEIDGDVLPSGGELKVRVRADAGNVVGRVRREFLLIWRLQGEKDPHRTLLTVKASVND